MIENCRRNLYCCSAHDFCTRTSPTDPVRGLLPRAEAVGAGSPVLIDAELSTRGLRVVRGICAQQEEMEDPRPKPQHQ